MPRRQLNTRGIRQLVQLIAITILASTTHGELKLPRIFSDNMVLQTGDGTAVWGWAEPGVTITVSFLGATGTVAAKPAVAGADRKWLARLPRLEAGATGALKVVSSSGEEKQIPNVLVGEVWLGSGQSNMSYLLKDENAPPEFMAVARAEAAGIGSSIRFFMTDHRGSEIPLDDVSGVWTVANPDNVGRCSAVAWNFGVALNRELRRPIGLVVSAVGGTPAEAWISKTALDSTKVGPAIWARHQAALAASTPAVVEQYRLAEAAWQAENPTPSLKKAHASTRPHAPYVATSNYAPNRLYNAMIHGLAPYTFRGIIWFQADGNNAHPEVYPELIRTLITSWRSEWNAELPFYYVEMNNMHGPQKLPVEPAPLCLIREAQQAALALPHTGVATSIDLGIENPHFPRKKPVGERLAGLALADAYGRPGLVQSPECAGSEFLPDGKVRIKLKYAQGLHVTGGDSVRGFAIRETNGAWHWASGRVEGETVIVWSEEVKHPGAVRYGWALWPVISLANAAQLPLRPFRTDPDSPQ